MLRCVFCAFSSTFQPSQNITSTNVTNGPDSEGDEDEVGRSTGDSDASDENEYDMASSRGVGQTNASGIIYNHF
jgi:hypothetical protein